MAILNQWSAGVSLAVIAGISLWVMVVSLLIRNFQLQEKVTQQSRIGKLSSQEIWSRLEVLQKQGWELLRKWQHEPAPKPVAETKEWAAEARKFVGENLSMKEIRIINDPSAPFPWYQSPTDSPTEETQKVWRSLMQCNSALQQFMSELV
ncbi:MAG: hypothetical protein ABIP85_25570 [Chthoniobacteraceae bacterium]